MAYTTTIQDKNGNQRTIKDPEALRANSNASNGNFDAAYIGTGYGTQTTASGATVAQTASLSNFLLLKNMSVSILFSKGITAANATLNINSTGAKALYYMGGALQPGTIRPMTIVTMVYDGTRYQIVSMEGLQKGGSPSDLYVDMGLPSGLLWAKANIDITTDSGFQEVNGAVSPFKYECSFVSWGNTEMFNPKDSSSFNHDFGTWDNSKNANGDGYKSDSIYGQTPGCALTANMAPSQDAARANLGAPWRMPTTTENQELFDNCDFVEADGSTVIAASTTNKLVTVDGIVGIYLKSKVNGSLLFFACSGNGYGSSWSGRGGGGDYWSASFGSAVGARYLYFYSGGVSPQNWDSRYYGFAVRAVQ